MIDLVLGNGITITHLLATDDDGDVDGDRLLVLVKGGSEAGTLSAALGIVVLKSLLIVSTEETLVCPSRKYTRWAH